MIQTYVVPHSVIRVGLTGFVNFTQLSPFLLEGPVKITLESLAHVSQMPPQGDLTTEIP